MEHGGLDGQSYQAIFLDEADDHGFYSYVIKYGVRRNMDCQFCEVLCVSVCLQAARANPLREL